MVLAGMMIAVLAAVGLGVAQNQQPLEPPQVVKPPIATETAPEIANVPADIPRLTPAQQNFDIVRDKGLFAGSSALGGGDPEQVRAAALQALAAEEAAAAPRVSQLPNQMPLPIQVADEVTLVVDELRGIARQLDLIAANDEDGADYARADRLRRAAARIRREARELREGKPTPEASLR